LIVRVTYVSIIKKLKKCLFKKLKNKIKATIIITAEKQEKFIERCIKSCLRQSINDIEIIVVFTKLKNIDFLKKKFFLKNLIFLKVKRKFNNSTQDQLFKIKRGFLISKGGYIFLLDGDDVFKKEKVRKVINFIKNKKILYLDSFENIKNKKKVVNRVPEIKKSKLYTQLINPWPKNICTSCISLNRRLLKEFFKQVEIKKYNYMAIDILLVIYIAIKYKIFQSKQVLTEKYFVESSVDSYYVGLFNRFYWLRRMEQHNFYSYIRKSKKINLDLILTKLINFFIK